MGGGVHSKDIQNTNKDNTDKAQKTGRRYQQLMQFSSLAAAIAFKNVRTRFAVTLCSCNVVVLGSGVKTVSVWWKGL